MAKVPGLIPFTSPTFFQRRANGLLSGQLSLIVK